jgi:hypothetical protein
MKKIYLIIFAMFFYGTIVYSQCQLVTPLGGDKYDMTTNTNSAVMTGNDVLHGLHMAFNEYITVNDGDPHLSWSDGAVSNVYTQAINTLSSSANSNIEDPDVVLFESYDCYSMEYFYYAIIVYRDNSNGDIHYLVNQYDHTALTPQWITLTDQIIGNGLCPNIDATTPETNHIGINKFVITWGDNGTIKAYVGDFDMCTNQTTYGVCNTSNGPVIIWAGENVYYPDVAISYTTHFQQNPSDYTVSFTYCSDKYIYVHQEDFTDIQSGSIQNAPNPIYYLGYSLYQNNTLPRIACGDSYQYGGDPNDFEIVYNDRDPSGNDYILGFNQYHGQPVTITNIECSGQDANRAPVVCYTHKSIEVTWMMGNGNGQQYNIVNRMLGHQGVLMSSFYSLVNMNVNRMQEWPSISYNWDGSYNVYYSWIDEDDLYIKTKESPYFNLNKNLKINPEDMNSELATEQDMYPNPASKYVNFLSNGIGILQLFDMKGSEILKTNIQDNTNLINIEGIAPGIYQVKTTTNNSVETKKLVIE